MDKVKFDIPDKGNGKWGSYISKYPADSGRVQPNMFTSGTRNVISSATGQAEKRSGGAIWNPNSAFSGAALDQYEAVFATGTRLFVVNDAGTLKASTGNGLFTSITAGFTNPANFEFATYQSRAYGCNGIDSPIVMDINTSYGGVTYSFTTAKTKAMGAQAPGSAPTATLVVTSTTNQVPAGAHTYKITFVYYSGVEESNGGSASSPVTNDATHTSNSLTAIPVGGYGCTARNIYRDNNDGNWLLLDSIPNNTATTYTDILPVGSTPTAIPTTNALPPVFKYIALYLDRLFVIDITGKTLAWSNAGQPDVFNPKNTINGPQDDVMTAIYIYNGIPWVFGQHTVGQILGLTDGTFYYNPVSSSVGCIDNRSIQTRSIISTPTMLWLAATPNKGIYYTNGSVVQYLSDFIEDLTFNLAQVSYLQRSNTQQTQAAFQGGTASTGIDLLTNPGTIQTLNPKASYSHAADWAAGTLVNLAPIGDTLQVPTQFAPAIGAGSLGGSATISGSNVTLPTVVPYTGDTAQTHITQGTLNNRCTMIANPILPPVSGTMTSWSLPNSGFQGALWLIQATGGGTLTAQFTIWADNGGVPGTVLFAGSASNLATYTGSEPSLSFGMTGGVTYWVGYQFVNCNVADIEEKWSQASFPTPASGGFGLEFFGGNWIQITCANGSPHAAYNYSFAYSRVAISASGTWTSPINDTHSTTNTASGMKLVLTASYPASTSISVVVQGSANGSSWTTTDTLSSPTGTVSLTGGTYRYWQVIYNLSTTDNINAPSVNAPVLEYVTTGTWTSAPIKTTADITALSALTQNTLIPGGTSATITIATSASQSSGYSSFVAIGSAMPNIWAKIMVTLNTDAANVTSPTLQSAELDWAITSNLISSAIDTGAVPAGWGLFQFQQVGTSGTVSFFFRTASTSGGLTSATFAAVTNGGYPTNTVLEFCQWKAVISATADNIPEVDSVTVNWLLTSGANVRAASLFFNKSYYLSVATTGSTTNNTLIELDYEGNWRVHSGVTIGTMATYFNDAFYCDATNGKAYNGFQLPTDNGTPIVFDLRTKCFPFGDDEHLALPRACRIKGVNTGTTIHVYYSVDKGITWIEMLNSSGSLGYATTNDMSAFNELFVPNFASGSPTSGTTIMFRVVSSDAFKCQILKIRPTVYVRKGKYVAEANA